MTAILGTFTPYRESPAILDPPERRDMGMPHNCPPHSRVGGIRWTICALLFAAITINYRDRQILGILAPVLEREIGWSEVQYGSYWILFLIAASAYLVALGIIQLLTPALKPAQMDDLN